MYKIIGCLLILSSAFITYEIWRAPLMRETEDGQLRTVRPTKRLRDLFKRKK